MMELNEGTSDGECGKLIGLIGMPLPSAGAANRDPGAADKGSGTDDNGAPAESLAIGTSEITGADVTGKAGMLPNPGRPNCGSAGRPSSAER